MLFTRPAVVSVNDVVVVDPTDAYGPPLVALRNTSAWPAPFGAHVRSTRGGDLAVPAVARPLTLIRQPAKLAVTVWS